MPTCSAFRNSSMSSCWRTSWGLLAAAAALMLLAGLPWASASPPGAADRHESPPEPLRIWLDEFFFAEGETVLLREAVAASGGASVIAGTTHNRIFQLKSYQQAGQVDVMWTGKQGCYEAFRRHLNASHAVSCVPGTKAVTGKVALVSSLATAYGEAAWGLMPRSFHLPQQYAELALQLKREQCSGHNGLWVLKEDVHRGKGVDVVTPPQALARGLDPTSGGGSAYVMVQRFLGEQYLVGGRPFYIRVWAVLMGADPARAYLFDGGVVVFGQQQQEGQAVNSLIVNLWTQDRATAAPWSLRQLEQHLAEEGGGTEVPRRLRRQLHTAVSASLAAGLPAVRYTSGQLGGFQGGSFEVLGVDFLLDASLRPWLVEVNQLPSMARKVVACARGGPSGRSSGTNSSSGSDGNSNSSDDSRGCKQDVPFDHEKQRFLRGLLHMLTERHRQHASLAQQAQQVLQAASNAAVEEQTPPCVSVQQLHQLLSMQAEQAAAERLGFMSLTAQLYHSLACMGAKPSGGGSSSSIACDVLAELALPVPPQRQECSAPFNLMGRLLAWLHCIGESLRLEAASLLPRLRHPAARRQQARLPAVPYQLRPSDERMLAWMQRGSPPLGSPQVLLNFCGVGDAAPHH